MELRQETPSLISGHKVSGTAVYNRGGEHLGQVEDVMVDKVSGKVAYAVMSFGGFLGIGEKYHPLPWERLTYDTSIEGYVVDLSKEQLEGAPAYDSSRAPDWADQTYLNRLHNYYGVPPYWL